jgi:uncharacterized NAD-dependent epimerase/dehydratase family protein
MRDVAAYKRILLLTGDCLGVFTSKTAAVLLRYRGADVVGVIDAAHAGRVLSEIIPGSPDRPIVPDVAAAAALHADAVFVGVHPTGGALSAGLRQHVADALRRGIDVVSGLHTQLSEDPEFAGIAADSNAQIIDLRRAPTERCVASGRAAGTRCRRVLTVGTDCNVGKMVTALELTRAAEQRGLDARFIATGQTGMMVSGRGVAIDAVVSDFAAGAVEQLVVDAADADLCVVEGQGSIGHPGFSGVTLSILHGACPDAMILVHHAGRTHNRSPERAPLPPLRSLWTAYEQAAALLHPARIVGVALNAHGVDPAQAAEERKRIEGEFGVPVQDPFEDGCDALLSAALAGDAAGS